MSVSVKKIHAVVGVLPIDLRHEYLQGKLCYRLIRLNSSELVHNRNTTAADGPLIKTYLERTTQIQVSPPSQCLHNVWNNISPEIRNSETDVLFKSKLKSKVDKYFKIEFCTGINMKISIELHLSIMLSKHQSYGTQTLYMMLLQFTTRNHHRT